MHRPMGMVLHLLSQLYQHAMWTCSKTPPYAETLSSSLTIEEAYGQNHTKHKGQRQGRP